MSLAARSSVRATPDTAPVAFATLVGPVDATRRSIDAQSLEKLVLVCLESLANLAQTHGQRGRAARLLEAARHLRQEPDAGSDELTTREWDVARLVARGSSNRQIAHELIVSERTVDTHVSHILHKLGLVSRAQIAAWVVEHQRRFKVPA